MPTFQKQDSVHKYLNSRIKKLHKNKSELIKSLHKLKHTPNNQRQITYTKEVIKLVKEELKKEFSKAVTSYWENLLKQINHRKSGEFFSQNKQTTTS